MPLTDEDAALQAIGTLASLSDGQKQAQAKIADILVDGEPFVDVHELFGLYNVLYFRSLLLPRVEVLWSPRLTLYVSNDTILSSFLLSICLRMELMICVVGVLESAN
jgi:hypothetical protein